MKPNKFYDMTREERADLFDEIKQIVDRYDNSGLAVLAGMEINEDDQPHWAERVIGNC